MIKYCCPHNIYMNYFSTKQHFFIPSYGMSGTEAEKIDRFLKMLDKSGVNKIIESTINYSSSGGRPQTSNYDLLSTVLFCFAFGKGSLREIEEQTKYDIRVIYLMSGQQASYKTIGNFINNVILPYRWEIFSLITLAIFDEIGLEMKTAYIDGSKFEANANKYKFVWKPTKYHEKLSEKVRELLKKYSIDRGIKEKGIIPALEIAKKIVEFNEILVKSTGDKKSSSIKKDYKTLNEYLLKSLEYEEKERICGPDRNSYYKTDHDATAMTLKEDYYSGLGSNMHAAYCVQLMVINGLISSFIVTQSRNDTNDFIPILDKHYQLYKEYPERICADAGYGSLENYEYIETKEIKNFVKYYTWEGNVSGKNPSQYHLNDDGSITCLEGKNGYPVYDLDRHPKYPQSLFYKVEGCSDCRFSSYCKRYMKDKEENFKIFEIRPKLQLYIQNAEKNLLSAEGIEMRINRSAQVEGAFGIIKQDLQYERFRRKSLEKAELEFMLVVLGYNIRKLFKFYSGKSKTVFWKAPDNLVDESFKKPSAKRLSNKVKKKKEKSSNQIGKDSYKYKDKKGCD